MYRRCLVCGTGFPENDLLEHLSRGDRIAYDPAQGRLWQVCRRCRRWSLVPMETRWEALEELERTARDRGRTLSSTAHVALLRAGPLELVRVGGGGLPEEAWWRFGREFRERRRRAKAVATVGGAGVGALAIGGWATGGLGFLGAWLLWSHRDRATTSISEAARWLRFGSSAWRGEAECPICGTPLRRLAFRDREAVRLRPSDEGQLGLALHAPCFRCRDLRGGLVLEGSTADRALRRLLAYQNHAGAPESIVRAATGMVEEAGSGSALAGKILKPGAALGSLHRTGVVALEIAAEEDRERTLLELEVAELEAHWRREEELASIIDGELTPSPPEELLRRIRALAGRRDPP